MSATPTLDILVPLFAAAPLCFSNACWMLPSVIKRKHLCMHMLHMKCTYTCGPSMQHSSHGLPPSSSPEATPTCSVDSLSKNLGSACCREENQDLFGGIWGRWGLLSVRAVSLLGGIACKDAHCSMPHQQQQLRCGWPQLTLTDSPMYIPVYSAEDPKAGKYFNSLSCTVKAALRNSSQ